MRASCLVCAVLLVAAAAAPVWAQAARFTRPTDTIKVFGETTLSNTYTFEAVVMRESATAESTRLFGEQLNAQEDKGFSVAANGTGGSVWNNGCGTGGVTTTITTPLNQWSHVAFVRNGTHFYLFIDGQMVTEDVGTCPGLNAVGGNMAIGAMPYTFTTYVQPSFIGRVDWLRISAVARYTAPFQVSLCEPNSDSDTLLLLLFDDPPGTVAPFDWGPSHFNTTAGAGFTDATAPTFGLPGPGNGIGLVTMNQSAGVVCPGSGAAFSVTANGAQPIFYQWQLETSPGNWMTLGNDPAPLPCGGNASHAYATPINSPSVTIGVHGCSGPFRVRCRATSGCESAMTAPVPLFVNPGDMGSQGGVPGGDGHYDNNDFVVFIDRFFSMSPAADVGVQGGALGSDGLWDNNDFVSFINLFFTGC